MLAGIDEVGLWDTYRASKDARQHHGEKAARLGSRNSSDRFVGADTVLVNVRTVVVKSQRRTRNIGFGGNLCYDRSGTAIRSRSLDHVS